MTSSRSSNKNLQNTLRIIVQEHGIENVERALAGIKKSTVVSKRRKDQMVGRSPPKATTSKVLAKSSKPNALEYVRKFVADQEHMPQLLKFAHQYDNKIFLPTIGEIRNFCSIHEIEVPASLSRASSIPRIFKYLSQLSSQEMQVLLESSSFSGPARLELIADAIRRSSSKKRATDLSIKHNPETPSSSKNKNHEKKKH